MSVLGKRQSNNSLLKLLRGLSAYRWLAVGCVFSVLILTTANVSTPQIFRWGIDQGLAKKNSQVVLICGGLLILVAIVRGLFSFIQKLGAEKIAQGVSYDLRNQLFSKTQNLSFSYHDRTPSSQLLTRITSDIEQIRTFFGTTILDITTAAIMLVSSTVILLLMNWQLALITLAVVPISGYILISFFIKNTPLFITVRQQLANLNGILGENLLGMREVKAFVRSPVEVSRYTTANDELLARNMKVIYALRSTFPLIFLLSNLIVVVIIGYGGIAVINHKFSLGELIAFNSYLALVIQPVLQIGFAASVVAQATASTTRVYQVLDTEIEVSDSSTSITLEKCKGRITFSNVYFKYPEATIEVLKGVSFDIKPREIVAIFGVTGSGKSTIASLIPRFYDVSAGSVAIDGYDVRNLTKESLRSHVGVVFQQATLFSGTIRDNIAYAVPNATFTQIITAAKLAQIHDFIIGLPDGYDTVIGERGLGLSGGQKQRISLARTLLPDYSILILDDTTSAVDAKTANLIQDSLNQLTKQRNCTVLMIAQRISTIRNADRILLIDQGQIIAQGTHEQLMESPLYLSILQSQIQQSAVNE